MNKYSVILIAIVLSAVNSIFCADVTKKVNVGETFSISRPQNAGSTGYSWSPLIDDEDIVVLEKREYESPKSKGGRQLIGASGTVHFIFKALKPGGTTITFELRRPWEAKKAAAQTFTADVTVTR